MSLTGRKQSLPGTLYLFGCRSVRISEASGTLQRFSAIADMASHEELLAELPKLEKLSNAARLKLAKKRRQKQLKKYQETVRLTNSQNQNSLQKKGVGKVCFSSNSLLHDLVLRNDVIEGQYMQCISMLKARCRRHSYACNMYTLPHTYTRTTSLIKIRCRSCTAAGKGHPSPLLHSQGEVLKRLWVHLTNNAF